MNKCGDCKWFQEIGPLKYAWCIIRGAFQGQDPEHTEPAERVNPCFVHKPEKIDTYWSKRNEINRKLQIGQIGTDQKQTPNDQASYGDPK